MSGQIRKISVGKNYPDGAIHYQVGTKMYLEKDKPPYLISDILVDKDYLGTGQAVYNVYLQTPDNTKVLWKQVSGLPVLIENNIHFD